MRKFNFPLYILPILLICIDLIALVISLHIAIFLRVHLFDETMPIFDASHTEQYYWMIIITLFIYVFEKIYFIRYDFWSDIRRILKGLALSFLAVFTVITLAKMSDDYSRFVIIMFFITATFLVPIFKRIFKRLLFSFDIFKIKVKIVANSSQYDVLYDEIKNNWYFGYKNTQDVYDKVIISSKNFDVHELQQMIKKFTNTTKDIYVIPYIDYLNLSHTNIIDYSNIRLSALHIENRLLNFKSNLIKYIFEKIVVLLLFPIVFISHLFISLAIRLDSNGGAIFKQKRLGKESQHFSCYKYRTMFIDSEKILDNYLVSNPDQIEYYKIYHKYQNDPRITKVGNFLRKTSLDELPQFYNILLGNMNLIGPRPYMISEKSKIGQLNEELILKVKPGITGLWQVSGRNELTFQQRVDLDTWYIQNWSLWMDFVIFMKTIKVVLSKVGAK